MTSFEYWSRQVPPGTFLCSLCLVVKPLEQAARDEHGDAWDTCVDCARWEGKAILQ